MNLVNVVKYCDECNTKISKGKAAYLSIYSYAKELVNMTDKSEDVKLLAKIKL